ncbi:helix-turn-helix transcriptional regulator [Massilia sp. CCM 8734]|uniref:helix-turn-helix domain-containing protein n=1 Tax=Massilia sp. CCM 8734 TaxID=2609283 RepID=UPI00142449BD|nr:helix-turn-helix transcriptional regulator [Massilia sp. CCM 8734]NHZ98723.1 helix-turn-helix domain-containing protein [Massilia sp. CCM 8734]
MRLLGVFGRQVGDWEGAMLEFSLATEKEIREELTARLRQRRLIKGITLETLAERAGMGKATLQRLETRGDCTFENFIRAVLALGMASELQDSFALKSLSIAQMERDAEHEKRMRAPRKPRPKGL